MNSEDIKLINKDNIREYIIPYQDKSKIDLEKDVQRLIKILSQCSNLISNGNLTNDYLHTYLSKTINDQIKIQDSTLKARYVEAQEGLGCGRHAMNNLLGKTQFILTKSENEIIDYKNPLEQIDLRSLCNQVNKDIEDQTGIKDNYLECDSCEFYNAPLFVAAFGLVGYRMEIGSILLKQFKMYRQIKNWKIIINYGGGHWVCAKNENDRYIFIDSIRSRYLTYRTFDELTTKHISEDNQIFLVTFEGKLIDPVNPYLFRDLTIECDFQMFDKVLYRGEEYYIIDRRYDADPVDGIRKCSHLLLSKKIVVGEDKSKFIRKSTESLIKPGKIYKVDNSNFGFNDGDKVEFDRYIYNIYKYGNVGNDYL